MAQTITLGDVTITRIVEWEGDIAPALDVVPDSTPELWEENRSWLAPDFWDPETGLYRAHMQTWVVRSEGKTVLVDTGAGNDKERPYLPILSRLNTGFLDDLAQAGVRPEDVDYVINTHVHADHVGWNTVLADREWVPTFPNAKYLINKTDFDFWNPINGTDRKAVAFGLPAHLGNQNMFEDSVAPVHQAGQAVLWEDSYVIDANLRLDMASGHTPGSGIVTLRSGTDSAVFVGDVMHSPVQILDSDLHTCFDEEPKEASATRRRVLEWAADHNALILPAHFPGSGAAEVQRTGSRFEIKEWAAFSPEANAAV
ncbi:MBL fold metallo-hydrolase [Streptomyces sp. NPDC005931]|uniref:MBL fold metallo-hydrolase n=1 Tax=Streptomyces sp. NPDC005931 TaxID=3364737 RepID=UPI0036CF7594